MSFSASHPDEPGRRIAPFEDGVTRAVCGGALEDGDGNDTGMTCDTVVFARHGSAATEGRSAVRSHWVHSRRRDGSTCATAAMTPWHLVWQEEVPAGEREARTEGRVISGGTHCRPDIVTHYGWVIELQHSALAKGVITTRERVYEGKVLWVIDATAGRTESIEVDEYPGRSGWWWRWTSPLWWATEMLGRVAVDVGESVWMLPATHAAREWDGEDLYIPADRVVEFRRDEFVDKYVNGTADPFADDPSEWQMRKSGRAAKPRKNIERPVPQDGKVCLYVGDRDLLIHEEFTPGLDAPVAVPESAKPAADVRSIVGPSAGPCARCHRIITRYGAQGHPLCNGCHAEMLAATGRATRTIVVRESA